jgi:hypothetical protein
MVIGLWIVVWILVCVIVVRELSRPIPSQPSTELPYSPTWFKTMLGVKTPTEPAKDYPIATISRTRGPWRRQMRDLQADHNTKQKERDAFTRPKPMSKETNPYD